MECEFRDTGGREPASRERPQVLTQTRSPPGNPARQSMCGPLVSKSTVLLLMAFGIARMITCARKSVLLRKIHLPVRWKKPRTQAARDRIGQLFLLAWGVRNLDRSTASFCTCKPQRANAFKTASFGNVKNHWTVRYSNRGFRKIFRPDNNGRMDEDKKMSELEKRLLEIDMVQAHEEHRDAGQSGFACIRIWILVLSSPFLALGSAAATGGIDFEQNSQAIFPYLRAFILFGGIMGFLLILLHNSKDAARAQSKLAMNWYRGLLVHLAEADRIKSIPLPIDATNLTNPVAFSRKALTSFSVLFACFGGATCGLYIGAAVSMENIKEIPILPISVSVLTGAVLSAFHLRARVEKILVEAEKRARATSSATTDG